MHAVKSLQGILPIVNSTFHQDGSIDMESQLSLVRHLISQGVHGVALFGNASEGYTLSEEERSKILKAVVAEVAGQVPVIVSTGHTGTDQAVRQSLEASDMGADALMVLPPYLLKPDGQGVFEYFNAISNAVSIPIMVQDAPLMTQVPMPVALLARMAKELEHVTYVKVEAPPTAPKISDLVQQAGNSVVALGGLNANFLIEELDRGAQGTMPGCDLCASFVKIWDLYKAGERTQARRLFTNILPLIRYELQPGLGVSVMKHNLAREGIIACARVRHPTRHLDAVAQREAEELWKDIRAATTLT
jgi:2-keto-3-deoxy-L-arabinonate dehydratase